ncbi:hypothetical protein KIL84_017155 [Mauremys mutica]|uniref:Uncharacterized protein n=1 Tax=Mauremys mutica TaxID=74926 RepID=A0A9D3X4U0_9SAUR|nr:hypothetical protein KIL84_017155 [Mauremys mutica]
MRRFLETKQKLKATKKKKRRIKQSCLFHQLILPKLTVYYLPNSVFLKQAKNSHILKRKLYSNKDCRFYSIILSILTEYGETLTSRYSLHTATILTSYFVSLLPCLIISDQIV